MRKSLKLTLAAVGVAAPIVLGMAYTAGASVGELTGLTSHNVDQWIMNEDGSGDYVIDREEIDGVVTLVVTDPDGELVESADYPEFIEAAAAEFGSDDWTPRDAGLFEVVDGAPCYHEGILNDVLDQDPGDYTTVATSEDGTFVIDIGLDGGIDAAFFAQELSNDQLEKDRDGGLYGEIEGAQSLTACP